MKSRRVIWTEGCLYVIIGAGSSLVEFLVSDRPISSRSITACSVIALVAGANSFKAFLSQSMSEGRKPPSLEVKTQDITIKEHAEQTPVPTPTPPPADENRT